MRGTKLDSDPFSEVSIKNCDLSDAKPDLSENLLFSKFDLCEANGRIKRPQLIVDMVIGTLPRHKNFKRLLSI